MVPFPNNAQALEGQELVDEFNIPRSPGNERRLPAGRNDARAFAKDAFDALNNAVHHVCIAVKEPGLQRLHRIGADDFSRVLDLDPEQSSRARK